MSNSNSSVPEQILALQKQTTLLLAYIRMLTEKGWITYDQWMILHGDEELRKAGL